MKILAIDTATEACSVALAIDRVSNIDQLLKITPSGHSDLVLGMVNELLRKHGTSLKDLDAVAVDIGPGSFTGLRIGIGVAQGLAYGAGLPVIGIGSLDVLAAQCPDGVTVPAIDARMKQIYWGVYEQRRGVPARMAGPFVASPNEVDTVLTEITSSGPFNGSESDLKIFSLGSGWDQYAESLPDTIAGKSVIAIDNKMPQALQVAELALKADSAAYCSPLELTASYVRNEVAKQPSNIQHKT